MKKFKFLVGFGLKKRVFRKAFLIANIFIFIILVGIINIPTIISWFSKSDAIDVEFKIELYNESGEATFSNRLKESLNKDLPVQYYLVEDGSGEFSESNFFLESKNDLAIVFSGTIKEPIFKLYSNKPEFNQHIIGTLKILIIEYQIVDYQEPTVTEIMKPDYEDPEQEAMLSSILSVLLLPMFILITMAIQFVGVDIIEEKSTKAIETIISSVPAKIHFFSKIVSSILFVVIQGVLLLSYGAIGGLLGKLSTNPTMDTNNFTLLKYLKDLIPNWPAVIFVAMMFMILGTLFYLLIAALFASMAASQEDYQQFQTPVMLMLLLSFYAGMFGPLSGGIGFIKVLSFIPMFSPMVAPIAYALGVITPGETLLAIVVMVLFLGATVIVITPVYKVTILSYDQTKFFKRIATYFKQAFPKNTKKTKK